MVPIFVDVSVAILIEPPLKTSSALVWPAVTLMLPTSAAISAFCVISPVLAVSLMSPSFLLMISECWVINVAACSVMSPLITGSLETAVG